MNECCWQDVCTCPKMLTFAAQILHLPKFKPAGNYTIQSNTTHWMACASDPRHCPVFPGEVEH